MEKVFDMYAKYYDLLYTDKDYQRETDYIENIIKKFNPESKKVLDLGCGTGRHDLILQSKGFDVTGVELSEKMVEIANKSVENNCEGIEFRQDDIRILKLNKTFDVIISLFHVMSYQVSNSDLEKTLCSVKEHLKQDGLFLFDFWYGPAVLTERPEVRIKEMESNELYITRIAKPNLRLNDNVVDVNYEIKISEKINGKQTVINEKHSMRYLFIPEIEFLLDKLKMEHIFIEEWITGREPDDKTWSVLAGVRNKKN